MDIEERKQRLDRLTDARERIAWHGETGEECPRCGVQVPAGYMLDLPKSDVTGCLRCLEQQAHLAFGGIKELPQDLVGVGSQSDAQRQVGEAFRAHIKASERGRAPPTRRKAQAQWAARSGWEATDQWDAPEERESTTRWPEKGARQVPRSDQRARFAERQKAKAARPVPAPTQPQELEMGPAALLGLTGTPTRDEVMSAFRKCAQMCHPDRGGSSEEFQAIIEARDTLLAEIS